MRYDPQHDVWATNTHSKNNYKWRSSPVEYNGQIHMIVSDGDDVASYKVVQYDTHQCEWKDSTSFPPPTFGIVMDTLCAADIP